MVAVLTQIPKIIEVTRLISSPVEKSDGLLYRNLIERLDSYDGVFWNVFVFRVTTKKRSLFDG